MKNEPIAIVGLGGVFPKAHDVASYWKNILEGRDCVVEVPKARWDWRVYWDADHKASDKTYSKIGGFVEDFVFDPLKYRIPPPVAAQMDSVQHLAIAATRQALDDAGDLKGVDPERVAVILGNSMGGAKKEASDNRVYAQSTLAILEKEGVTIPESARAALLSAPAITEDSMPGELSNVIAGRVANVFNFNGPNFTVDAACASSLAAVDMAVNGLRLGDYDAAVCGGVDQMMSPPAFVKFSKIGALSADGSRPFDAGANGFIMGEGAGVFVLKRLSDAVKAGDRVYAVIRAIGKSSDGRGKGITAPNPKGQKLAVERAFAQLEYGPGDVGLVEAHGTSTPVGDAVEVTVLSEVFAKAPKQSIALGSVKSQIGHLKAAAGAASMVKMALALHHKMLPPSINFTSPNPKADFPNSPFYVNTKARAWEGKGKKRANVSAFGFGGTNFHIALEEATAANSSSLTDSGMPESETLPIEINVVKHGDGIAVFQGEKRAHLNANSSEIALAARGIHISKPGAKRRKIAFMFPGQGSQYVDMMRDLKERYAIVQQTFDEADAILATALGRKLSSVVFSPEGTEQVLKLTEYTQPAVLTADVAILRLLKAYGVNPDVVCGHSLGEYGALVAAGVMTFENALHAVCARAKEMSGVRVPDVGKMASVALPYQKVEQRLAGIEGYVAVANKNCPSQTVIAGETPAVAEALARFAADGVAAQEIAVSHAFHSKIVAPAQDAYRSVLERMDLQSPTIPILSNVTADYYPRDVKSITDLLVAQIAAPVEFIRQIERMHADGVTLFVEVGPKRVLTAFVTSILEGKKDVAIMSSNHPKRGGIVEFNELLCKLIAEGVIESKVQTPKSSPAVLPPSSLSDPLSAVVSGVAVGAPGSWDLVFREGAADDILRGQNLIEKLTDSDQQKQIDKNIVRLHKSETGDHRLEKLDGIANAIKLTARAGEFDIEKEFGLSAGLAQALDRSSALAMAAGVLALKDAGIPMTRTYRRTKTGSSIPTGWALPPALRDETGVIFASAFPGYDSLVEEITKYLENKKDYRYNRDFLLRVLTMGHSQMSQLIGARGPSVHVNVACASTTMAVGLAEDWIRLGRAKRVVVIGGDDITSEKMQEWFVTGFLAAGAATTESVVSRAALPFDKRRHGMIVGMGAVGIVVEEKAEVAKRGTRARAAILSTEYANSAFHATRLDTAHVAQVMDRLVTRAEQRHGIDRKAIAGKTLFMSHETYTPARGGSASAEVVALKQTFGDAADKVVVCNTKGFTGHTMGASLEDPIAILAMAEGKLPPIANYREPDPELAGIRLSDGGSHDMEYALRLGAGFGSQVAMTLMKRLSKKSDPLVSDAPRYQNWLKEVTGESNPQLEVVNNTLRVKETATAPSLPVASGDSTSLPRKGGNVLPFSAPSASSASKQLPAAVAVAPAPVRQGAQAAILAMVCEKTGYPKEMLDLDLDMEADLGIDTVKQAEIFGMLREKFELPKQEGLSLKDYPTLRHLIDYVEGGKAPSLPHPAVLSGVSTSLPRKGGDVLPSSAISADSALKQLPVAVPAGNAMEEILSLVAGKTGYPREMLELDLDMEADLGIDTVKQAEIFGMIREKYSLPKQENLSLKDYPTLRHLIDFVSGGSTAKAPTLPDAGPAGVPTSLPREGGKVTFRRYVVRAVEKPLASRGSYQIPAGTVLIVSDKQDERTAALAKAFGAASQVVSPGFRPTGPVAGIVHLSDARSLFLLAQALHKDLKFVVSVTMMDGRHGYAGGGTTDAGALTGITKSLRKELNYARVKAVDFDKATTATMLAEFVLAELKYGDGAVEIGYHQNKRYGIDVVAQDITAPSLPHPANSQRGVDLPSKEGRYLITGGGLGLGAEMAKALAVSKPRLTILGRTELHPDAAMWAGMTPDALKAFKAQMWETLKADTTKKATPAMLEKEFSKVAKAIELYRNIEAMHQAGAMVSYYACDLTNDLSLGTTLAQAQVGCEFDAVIHAAGLEESRLLADKKPEMFDAILKAKPGAARLLRSLVKPKHGQRWLFFSSVAGRFGNLGQTDYSAANDALCKMAVEMRAQGTWACAVDLTAFSEIGMATRGSVETFLKAQGVDFLDPTTGIKMIVEELAGGEEPEVVLAGSLGALDLDNQIKNTATTPAPAAAQPPRPMGGEFLAPGARGTAEGGGVGAVTIGKTFSLESDPYLKDHAIGGTPYVPGVIGIELFLQAAEKAAGTRPSGLSDIRFELPIKLLRNKAVAVRTVVKGADVKIESDFIGPGGVKLGAPRTHFKASLNGPSPAGAMRPSTSPIGEGFKVTAEGIYKLYFHGPGFQVLKGIMTVEADSVTAELAALPANVGPETVQGLPRYVEAMFQACGYRDLHFDKKTALPDAIEELRLSTTVSGHTWSSRRLFVEGRFKGRDAAGKSIYDAILFADDGTVLVELIGYRMIPIS